METNTTVVRQGNPDVIAPISSNVVPSPVQTSVPFSAGAVPFHQAAIWLAEIGVGAGITSARYPLEEMMELVMIARDLGSAMTLGFIGATGGERMVTEMQLPPVTKELHEMCKNSMECAIQEVRRLVKEERTKFGGSEKVEVFPIATYPNHVVVFNTNREVYRGTVERNNVTGRPYLVKVEKLEVRPVRDWLEEQLQGLEQSIDSLLEGKKKDARKKISEVISRIGSREGLLRAKYQVMARQLTSETLWRKFLAENRALVRRFLHGELGKLRDSLPRPRYSAFYTGSASKEEGAQVARRLAADLRDLSEKADDILTRISEMLKSKMNVLDERGDFRDFGSEIEMTKFRQFATDFVEDLQGLKSMIQEALKDEDVAGMAMLYDTAAARFDDYKIGGRLVEKALESLGVGAAQDKVGDKS